MTVKNNLLKTGGNGNDANDKFKVLKVAEMDKSVS